MDTIEQLFKETNRIKKAMAVKVSGQWIPLEKEIGLYECSICGHKILRAECNYCPNCGARMDEEGSTSPSRKGHLGLRGPASLSGLSLAFSP